MSQEAGSIAVLHVDDEPDVLEATTTALEREDGRLRVETAESAGEGLERLSEEGFDCVVSDYDMPGRTGIEFLEAVRETSPDLPFILFTGKGSEEVASEAISAGVTDYLQKGAGRTQYTVLANRIENAVSRYRSQRQIAAQRAQYQVLFEQAPVMYAVTRTSGGEPVIEDCNQRFLDRLGYAREDVIGEPMSSFYTAESTEALLDGGGYERALAGAFATEERGFVTADGEELSTLLRAVPRRDEDGEVIGTLTLYVDLTERREREVALEALHAIATEITAYDTREAVCRRTVEAASAVLDFDLCAIALEADGVLEIAAASAELPTEELSAMPVEEGLAGETFRTGGSFLVDDIRAHEEAKPQGPYRSAVSVPIGEHGVFQTVAEETGAFDETDLELAELLLAHTEAALDRLARERELEQYETIVETIPEGVFVLDADGRILAGNDRAATMLGYEPGELLEESFGRLIDDGIYDEAIVEEYVDHIQAMLAPDADREHAQFEHPVTVCGEERIYETHLALRPFDEEFRGTVGVFRDVTEQRRQERALRRQNERLAAFADIVSHDLRNPLTTAQGYLQLAREEGDPDHFERVAHGLDRMERIVEDVLRLARAGREIGETAPVDLREAVEDAWLTVADEAAEAAVDYADVARGRVEADPDRLGRLLENVLGNAIEHGGPGVTIRVERTADGFAVEDDGPGIPERERERVFERGYSTDDRGTGFGLAIVEEIAEAHGWEVAVTEGSDGGARIEVSGVTVAPAED